MKVKMKFFVAGYCIVRFVNSTLVGNYKTFQTQYEKPITAGQYRDSSAKYTRLMKKKSYLLHKRWINVYKEEITRS